jgi:xanthine dehydrogenase accessory factor
MEQVYRDAVTQLKDDKPVVLATVVRTSGSTPQKPGAKLLVREDGSGVGTLGGGCVEGDIWFAAKMLMKGTGGAQVRDYELNEDLAAEDGLICGGTMYFLIDPVRNTDDLLPFAEEIVSAYDGGVPVAVASVVKAPDDSGVTIGSKLMVRENGTTESTLGTPELDENASLRARKLMAMGKQEYVTHPSGVEYFVEAYTTPPRLILAGGGHVAKALAPVAASVGFKITVIDDRPEFANEERFPEADAVYTEDFVEAINRLPINANTFIVIATRGHRYDDTALEAAAQSKASYVALLGSKRKTILIYEALIERGLPMDRVRELRAPSGLDIQARTPAEIAVSIVAEMLMFRLGGDGRPMRLEERHLQRIQSKSAVTAAAD